MRQQAQGPAGGQAGLRSAAFAGRDGLQRHVLAAGQEGLDLGLALFRLQRTDRVDQSAARLEAVGGAVEDLRLHAREAGDVAGTGRPQHVRMAAEGAGGAARSVQQDGVEGPRIFPDGRVGGDDLGGQAHALQVLGNALEAGGRAVQGHDVRAGGGQLQRLAARRGAEVQHLVAGLDGQEARGDGGGGVLHPPGPVLEVRPGGDVALAAGAQRVARQDLGLEGLCQDGGVGGGLQREVGGRLDSDLGGDLAGRGVAERSAPAGIQPGRGQQGRIIARRALAQQTAQHGVDQALERPAGLVGAGQFDRGRHGGEGRDFQIEGLGRAQAQQVHDPVRRGLLQLGGQGAVDGAQMAQHGHGQGAGERALARLQEAETVGRSGFVDAAATRQGRVDQGQGGFPRGEAVVQFLSHRLAVPRGGGERKRFPAKTTGLLAARHPSWWRDPCKKC